MLMKWIREMLWRAYALINQIYLKFAALASMASITSFAKFDSCRIPPHKFAYFSYGLHSKAKHSAVNHIQCTDPEILKIINIGLTLLLVWGRNWFFVSFWQLWSIKKFLLYSFKSRIWYISIIHLQMRLDFLLSWYELILYQSRRDDQYRWLIHERNNIIMRAFPEWTLLYSRPNLIYI